jgi:hypothetical protein
MIPGRGRRARSILAGLAAGLLLAHPSWGKATPEPEPFRVPVDSLVGRTNTVALVPTETPRDVPGSASAGEEFMRSTTERLIAAGFAIVPAESVRAIWKEAGQAEGGMFDPRTGRRDPVRFERIRARAARVLREHYRTDVCLKLAIVVVSAEFESGEARWDGVTRDVGGAGILNFLVTGVPEGRLPALSLAVDVEEPEGRSLYHRQAGLQTLSRADNKLTEIGYPQGRFGDEAVKTFALDRALGPWIEQVRPNAAPPSDPSRP